MWRLLSNFLRAGDWSPCKASANQRAERAGRPAPPEPAGNQVGAGAAPPVGSRAGTVRRGSPGRASMPGDRAAGLRALLAPPPPPLLLLLLLSRAAALDPSGLFPYGQFRGDQLLKEGDDESSAAVKLASPLRFYEAQFNYLYVSSAPSGRGTRQVSRSSFPGVHAEWVSPNPVFRGEEIVRTLCCPRAPLGWDQALRRCCCRTRRFPYLQWES